MGRQSTEIADRNADASARTTTDLAARADKYQVVGKLGQGGMATVNLALAHLPGGVKKLVVLKSIRSELVMELEVRKMFLDEARLASKLNHPNVVQTFEVATIGGSPVMVMEYMEGQPLSRILQRAREGAKFPLELHLKTISSALAGLEHAHTLSDFDGTPLNLVHRDVSPQNIFVTYDGGVKLLDFGIAKALGSSTKTELGVMKGKVRYMPPEQMLAFPPIDRRADIFAVGVMMWEALTGVRLWKDMSDVHIINSVVNDGVPSPKSINPDVADVLNEICVKALERNRDDRFASAGDMELAIGKAMQQLGMRAMPRDLAKHVCEVFAITRADTKKIIEKQLSSLGDLRPVSLDDGAEEIDVVIPDAPSIDLAESRVSINASVLSTVKPRRARRNAMRAGIAGLSIALVGVAGIFAIISNRPASAPNAHAFVSLLASLAPSASVSAPVLASNSASESVHIHVDTNPPNALLTIDGQPVANPFDRDVAPDSNAHTVIAAWGATKTTPMPIRFSERVNITIEMPKSQQIVAPWPVPSGARSATRPATKPHCDNPFYVDSAGIRRVRPECL